MYVVILRRMGQGVIVALAVVVLVFVVARILPGDPARIMNPHATEENLAKIREDLGLAKPLYLQFVRLVGEGAARGTSAARCT